MTLKRSMSVGRSEVLAVRGMVATSQPLATQAGIEILRIGGNAVDAAVAASAVLDVVEPFSTGCGGDAFVLIHQPGASRPLSLNGSGRSGSLVDLDELLERGWTKMPARGGAPVTVPGAMHLWYTIQKAYGALEFEDVLAPAIYYARNGFPVSPLIASSWSSLVGVLQNEYAIRTFTINGHAPKTGEIMRNLDLANTFETVVQEGIEAFYNGAIAESIVNTVQQHGGFLTLEDLRAHRTEQTEAISIDYGPVRVFEHPPNSQGFAALLMLKIMHELDISNLGPNDPDRYHLMIEAKKLAYADLHEHNADPAYYSVPLDRLLSSEYVHSRAGLVHIDRALSSVSPGIPMGDDTIYLATADSEGRAVSFINSLYQGFGSGLVADGTGIKLQNRGSLFSLDPRHPNRYAPRKRPFHTIIPGALYSESSLYGVFGIMGGAHQAQAHAQFVSNLIDCGMSPQAALDHPRFNHDQSTNTVSIEAVPRNVRAVLRRRGHTLVDANPSTYGGGQVILRLESCWIGASDKRKDGQAAGY